MKHPVYINPIFHTCLTVILCAIFSFGTNAQPGAIDNTFNPIDQGYGSGDDPWEIYGSMQIDEKIILCGDFINYKGSNSWIVRLNNNSSADTTFNSGSGANSTIKYSTLQSDGKIIIGGYFTSYNETACNYFARLNSDGSLDTTFMQNIGTNHYYFPSTTQNDGKILVNYAYTPPNEMKQHSLIRLNSDGRIDTTYNSGTVGDKHIDKIFLQTDGKIIITGNFTHYNGTVRNCIARLNYDGSLDTTFNPGTGLDSYIRSIVPQNDGKTIIGGSFTSYNGIEQKYLARLNVDGNLDTTFNPGIVVNNTISEINIQNDGKIYIAGSFTLINKTSIGGIARLNSDWSLDTTFIPATKTEGYVAQIFLQRNGKIIICGKFTLLNEERKRHIARLNSDGSIDNTFNPSTGADNVVSTSDIQNDGKIIIAGNFHSYNGAVHYSIARLNRDGSLDTTFNPGTGDQDVVAAIAEQEDGKILIGGCFSSYYGFFYRNVVRLNADGSLDTLFNSGARNHNAFINAIAIQNDEKILIGGQFYHWDGISASSIARLNSDGSPDTTFNSGSGVSGEPGEHVFYSISNIAIQSDGKIIIGGNFSLYNRIECNGIARLNSNGSLDTTFNLATGTYVSQFALQSDGKIIINGVFQSSDGITSTRIARLNVDGNIDTTFNPGTITNSGVYAIALQNDEKIIFWYFTKYDGIVRWHIARLNMDGSLDTTFNPGKGPNDIIHTVSIQNDGRIIIGGRFTSYDGTGRNRIARLLNCTNTTSAITVTACNNYSAPDGKVHKTSGIKTAVIPKATGCDSIITIDLTINKVDTSILQNGSTLTSNASQADYQWLDCSNDFSIIPGETEQNFTAQNSGIYCVEITQNNCIDTSVCYSVQTVSLNRQVVHGLKIYPNPFSTAFTITTEGSETYIREIRIYSVTGTLLRMEDNMNAREFEMKRNGIPSGIYELIIITNQGKSRHKLLVK